MTPDSEQADAEARVWHPWLRINRVVRSMTSLYRDRSIRPSLKAGLNEAISIREKTRRVGWFN